MPCSWAYFTVIRLGSAYFNDWKHCDDSTAGLKVSSPLLQLPSHTFQGGTLISRIAFSRFRAPAIGGARISIAQGCGATPSARSAAIDHSCNNGSAIGRPSGFSNRRVSRREFLRMQIRAACTLLLSFHQVDVGAVHATADKPSAVRFRQRGNRAKRASGAGVRDCAQAAEYWR